MDYRPRKIQTFTDLNAWKEGHKLILDVYKTTKSFPKDEIFGITSQIRRCAVSVTSSMAEGFSRQSFKEKVQFYSMALGSVAELQNQLLVARDVGYLPDRTFQQIAQQSINAHKLINGLIKKSKSLIHNS